MRRALGSLDQALLHLVAVPGIAGADLHFEDGEPGVLADQSVIAVGDVDGFEDGFKDRSRRRLGFLRISLFQCVANIRRQIAKRPYVQLLGGLRHNPVIEFIHFFNTSSRLTIFSAYLPKSSASTKSASACRSSTGKLYLGMIE